MAEDERDERAHQLLREIGSLADQLSGLDHSCALAAFRGDYDDMCDAAELLVELRPRFNAAYFGLLAAGRPSGTPRKLAVLGGRATAMAIEVVPCVHPGAVDLRSSRNGPEDEVLHASAAEWHEFLTAVKTGLYDDLGAGPLSPG